MFDMINIFEVFLPQLLRYPNPTDPLNGEAAALLMRDPKTYEAKVKGRSIYILILTDLRRELTDPADYVQRYATKDAADHEDGDDGSEDEMSSVGEFDSGDEDPAGTMEV